MNELLISKAATDFRRENGFSVYEPIDLNRLLESLEIIAFFKPFTGDFSGMAIKQNEYKFILINTNQSKGRQNFTVAHELYHLFVQEDFTIETTYQVGNNVKGSEEYWADTFASCILLPEEGLLNYIPDPELEKKTKISLDTVVKLEQLYKVSRTALLIRLKELKLITQTLFDNYRKDVINSAKRRGYSPELYTPSNHELLIGNYGTLANKLVDEGVISEGDYYSLMQDIGIDILENNQPEPNEGD